MRLRPSKVQYPLGFGQSLETLLCPRMGIIVLIQSYRNIPRANRGGIDKVQHPRPVKIINE